MRALRQRQTVDDDQRFEDAVQQAHEIVTNHIRPLLRFYDTHMFWPRVMFRGGGILTILLGVTLPALAAAEFPHKTLTLSTISIAVAALTGLGSFFHWERTWHANSTTKVALDLLIAKWELELANARYVVAPHLRAKHVYLATDDLLVNARAANLSETEGFFANLQFPQSDRTDEK